MNYAMSTRFQAQGPCPRDGFGAVIVNRTTDTMLCATTGIRSTYDPTDHAEIRLIRECAGLFQNTVGPGAGRNKAVWAELSLYTTGESCPMCMSATRWAGLGENIYATSIDRLTELGFTQILISSLEVDKKSVDGNVVPATTLISFSNTAYYDQYFGWQFNATNPCPGGCVRNAANTCVVPTPTA
jgi:tRNA(Arg) A34 adenosine deaminase TadA